MLIAFESARFILSLTFSEEAQRRVHELLTKNQEGRISRDQNEDLDHFTKANTHLATLQSKGSPFPQEGRAPDLSGMTEDAKRRVRARAKNRCEYCQWPHTLPLLVRDAYNAKFRELTRLGDEIEPIVEDFISFDDLRTSFATIDASRFAL